VVGLGPAGQAMVRHLKERQMTAVILDTNPQSRAQAYELGVKVHLGDATNEEVLLHAGIGDVCMAVVTVPDPGATIEIVAHMRRLRPQLPIAARCRYDRHQDAVKAAGATIVVNEETLMGHELAHQVIDFMQTVSGETMACRLVGQPLGKVPPQNPSETEPS
jgi:CPA2 family monovalent cation:H+ antiporter-2